MPNYYNYTPDFYDYVMKDSSHLNEHTLKVYGSIDSRARRTLWVCRELEQDNPAFKWQHMDINFNDEVFTRGKINPNRRMPFIDDDGVYVFESMAINLYLCKKYGKTLQPKTLEEEALCLKWSFWAMTETDMNLWELIITVSIYCIYIYLQHII